MSVEKLQEVYNAVEAGKAKKVAAAVQEALDAGCEPSAILNEGMIAAMDSVGAKFKAGEIFVPEMLVAARAMKKGVDVLKPHLASGDATAAGKIIIGTVAGDLHDIGKNLVAMMMESAGFEVIDLGVRCAQGEVRRDGRGQPRHQDRRLLRPADHHHALPEGDRGCPERRSLPRQHQGHGRRRAHHPGLRR